MRLQDLTDLKFNSLLLRGLLKHFYRDGDVCTVRMGPLRGAKLVYHPSVTFHAILGLRDLDVFRFLRSVVADGNFLGRESIAADVGANIGLYSVWLSRIVHEVYAFEPAPEAQRMIAENLQANRIQNITLVKTACGATDGTVDLFLTDDHHVSSLDESWARGTGSAPQKVVVPVVRLNSYFSERQQWPDFIKMDIEGGGNFALPGATRCFEEKRPFLLIESHTPREDRAISDVMTAYDYAAYRFDTREWVADRTDIHPNPDGVWGTMFLCPAEMRSSIERRLK